MNNIRLGAVILGAGASSRMGQPKLLLPWSNTTIIGHLLGLWRSLGAEQLAVVCAPAPHPLHVELDRLGVPPGHRIVNPSPERGMFSSIQCAARWRDWQPELTHFTILLGDQPQIVASTLAGFLQAVSSDLKAIWQPAFAGRAKHPVVFPRAAFERLADTAHQSLRDFLHECGFPRQLADIPDQSLAVDLDTPEDYRLALENFTRGTPSSSERTGC